MQYDPPATPGENEINVIIINTDFNQCSLPSALSSVVHLSVQYPMVKGLSHTPPILLGTIFLSRSAPLIMSLLSDHELKLILTDFPMSTLSVVICASRSFIRCVV